MIFKSVLKYKIFEWCLDTLVNKLLINFNTLSNGSEVKVQDLTKGMRLSRIEILSSTVNIIYYGCNIAYFNHLGAIMSFSKDDIYDISFSFDKQSGTNHILGDMGESIWWMVRANRPNIKFFL